MASHVVDEMKKKYGVVALGSEGADVAEWVLVDFDSVVLHVINHLFESFTISSDYGSVVSEARRQWRGLMADVRLIAIGQKMPDWARLYTEYLPDFVSVQAYS